MTKCDSRSDNYTEVLMLTCILFDMGNTLIHYHAGPSSDDDKDAAGLALMSERLEGWGQTVSAEALKEKFYDPWVATFASRKTLSREQDITPYLKNAVGEGLTQDEIKTLLLDFHRPTRNEAVCDEGTRETLAHLKAAGLAIGMVSNTALPGYCHDDTLRHLKLFDLIDFRLYSYDEGVRKPDPDMFLRALRLARSTPQTTVMVGDSKELDINPARKIGMRTVHYGVEARSIPEIEATFGAF